MTAGAQPTPFEATRIEVPFARPSLPLGALLSTLHSDDLKAIAAAAIDVLDARAIDCDLEDDDPVGDALDAGEHPSDDARALAPIPLLYAVDQTRGPINVRAAERAFLAATA